MMRRNYALNQLKPVVVQAAAAAVNGEMSLDVGGEFWENSIVSTAAEGRRITVPALSLASLVKLLPEPPTVLICDIEGAESHLDFTQLPATVTRVIIEMHPHLIGEQRTRELVEALHDMGFRTGSIEEHTLLLVR